uniref:Uncharacterized protein n=1 Tax=Rhizophora mucronata TaxID=61149 RepID=A0A2P2M7L2_RHIMU
MPMSFGIVFSEELPFCTIQIASIVNLSNGKQVLCELHKLLVTVSVCIGLLEWLNYQTILWIHHTISS